MSKKLKVLFFVVVILTFSATTASAYEAIYKDLAVYDDGKLINLKTRAKTIAEALTEEDIILTNQDIVSKKIDSSFASGEKVTIVRGFSVIVFADNIGEVISVRKGDKVGFVIDKLITPKNTEYIYEGSYARPLEKDETIVLQTKRIEEVYTVSTIKFTEEKIEDPNLEMGQERLVTLGVNGKQENLHKKTYIDNIEVDNQLIESKVLIETINKVVAVGTKPENVVSTSAGNFKYKSVLTMNATAYTNSIYDTGKNPGDPGYGITASGMKTRVGIVAVDPKVIPLHTKLYIEGYGYSVAGDTGSAIKGNKIDLFYETRQEALNFGRKNITVYVLED